MRFSNPRKLKPARPKSGEWWEKTFFGWTAQEIGTCSPPISVDEALDYAVGLQSQYAWNPSLPSTDAARSLFVAVQRSLAPEHAVELKLYCAIGSPLDFQHGGDGFFRVHNSVVLVDLTTAYNKRSRRAVVYSYYESVEPEHMDRKAQLIARILTAGIRAPTIQAQPP